MTGIESVRQALAMRDAGYGAVPSPEHVAELLSAYDRMRVALQFYADQGCATAQAAISSGERTKGE